MTSTVHLKVKEFPLVLSLRILALLTILVLVGINLYLMPEQIQKIKYGYIYDIKVGAGINGTGAIVTWASTKAEETGVHMGDIVLNPEVNTPGDIGTPVTFLIQNEGSPLHEVTFLRISNNTFSMQLYSDSPPISAYI